jgi:hypothetical protein
MDCGARDRPGTVWVCGGGGAPGRIRTCDLPLRRRTLYPAELRAPDGDKNTPADRRNVLQKMVRPEGFEPPTYGFEARRSIQLSYRRTL